MRLASLRDRPRYPITISTRLCSIIRSAKTRFSGSASPFSAIDFTPRQTWLGFVTSISIVFPRKRRVAVRERFDQAVVIGWRVSGDRGTQTTTRVRNGFVSSESVCERAKWGGAACDERVAFGGIGTANRATFLEWGISDALFIDGEDVRTGPPPSYEKLKGLIEKRLKKL
jgi:hypothetical protein